MPRKMAAWTELETEGDEAERAVGIGIGFIDYMTGLYLCEDEEMLTVVLQERVVAEGYVIPNLIVSLPGMCGHFHCGTATTLNLN